MTPICHDCGNRALYVCADLVEDGYFCELHHEDGCCLPLSVFPITDPGAATKLLNEEER